MSQVRRNVIANFAGQAWSALMGVIFIPVYVAMLGVESFGLIGFYVTLQAFAVVLDLGLAGTINRELARRDPQAVQSTRDLVRTLEFIYWPLGLVVAALIWAGAGLIAQYWLQPVALAPARVEVAIALMGATVGSQWSTGFYVAGLNGLQRQVHANLLAAIFWTLRGAGVLLPLYYIDATIEVFFAWQVAVGVLHTTACAWALWSALPAGSRPARFSSNELARVGRFTAGLSMIALLSLGLTQADRIILSRLLPLDEFGVYVLAASVAAALLRIVQPWFNALYPRFAELHARHDSEALRRVYHISSQWLAATVLPVAIVVAVFAPEILLLWTRDPAMAIAAAPLLAVLISGTALNGLMNLPYAMQLAHGWTKLALWANVIGFCFVFPATLWLAQLYGAIGAAAVWPLLNLGYVLIVLPVMNRRILRGELATWYVNDVAPAAAAGIAVALLLRAMLPALPQGTAGFMWLLGIATLVCLSTLAASEAPRRAVQERLGNGKFLRWG